MISVFIGFIGAHRCSFLQKNQQIIFVVQFSKCKGLPGIDNKMWSQTIDVNNRNQVLVVYEFPNWNVCSSGWCNLTMHTVAKYRSHQGISPVIISITEYNTFEYKNYTVDFMVDFYVGILRRLLTVTFWLFTVVLYGDYLLFYKAYNSLISTDLNQFQPYFGIVWFLTY